MEALRLSVAEARERRPADGKAATKKPARSRAKAKSPAS
jgi:hypothetical protein